MFSLPYIDVSSHPPHLEDFDLTGGRVEVLCVLFTLICFKCVDLDAERHTLLSSMLAHGEFCADAVYLKQFKKRSMKLQYTGKMT